MTDGKNVSIHDKNWSSVSVKFWSKYQLKLKLWFRSKSKRLESVTLVLIDTDRYCTSTNVHNLNLFRVFLLMIVETVCLMDFLPWQFPLLWLIDFCAGNSQGMVESFDPYLNEWTVLDSRIKHFVNGSYAGTYRLSIYSNSHL